MCDIDYLCCTHLNKSNMNKQMRLSDFYNHTNVDGHYAVWKSKMFSHENQMLYGFSGEIVQYSEQKGFKDYPKWMDETPEDEIKIMLIEKLPDTEDFY